MINSKDLYYRANNLKRTSSSTKTNKQLLEDVYLGSIIAQIYELVVKSAINDKKFKVTYNPKKPIPIEYKKKIEERFTNSKYEINFLKDTTGKFIMHIVINSELEEYTKELYEDKILTGIDKEEVYNVLKAFYKRLTKNQFQDILDDIRKNYPSINQYGYNYNKEFQEMEYWYSSYVRDRQCIRLMGRSYDPDKYIIQDKYTYFYERLEIYGLIKRESSSPIITSGKILEDYLSCKKTSVYDPLRNKIYYINDQLSEKDMENCINILKKNLYKAEAVNRIIRFVYTYYPAGKIATDEDFYSYHKETILTEDMKRKYKGLSEDVMKHIYFSSSGPNRLLILERSPEVGTKCNYDRCRIQFSILGINNKKKYLENNKDEIMKYLLDKVSKNKFFKSVPINYFEITSITMNKSGDVTAIMELKKELLDMDVTPEE